MNKGYPKAWFPAVIGAGGMFIFSAIGGYAFWGIVASVLWIAGFLIWHKRAVYFIQDRMMTQVPHRWRDQHLKSLLKTISLHRHNFMNDLQLLLGYMQLHKFDKAQEFAENMKERAMQEGTLFHLGLPKLTLFLYHLQADHRKFVLDLELQPGLVLDQLLPDADACGQLIERLARMLCEHARPNHEHANELSIEMYQEDRLLLVHFIFNGQCDLMGLRQAYQAIEDSVRKKGTDDLTLTMVDGHDQIEMTVEFKIQTG